jgi:hypothetical protein
VGQKMVKFSDLSGELITDDHAVARIVIHEHPELSGPPVEIEVLADEARAVEKAGVQVALVDLYLAGDDEPRRVAMDLAAFDKLATGKPMSELLITARPARKAAKPREKRGTASDQEPTAPGSAAGRGSAASGTARNGPARSDSARSGSARSESAGNGSTGGGSVGNGSAGSSGRGRAAAAAPAASAAQARTPPASAASLAAAGLAETVA